MSVGGCPSAVTVGKFDGLHLGHRDVLRQLCDAAQARGLVPAVVTFDRNPLAVLQPDRAPEPLVSPAQKVELFEQAGIGAVLMLPFTEELARLSPEAFVTRILVDALHAELVLAGRDFRFGERGSGDLAALIMSGAGAPDGVVQLVCLLDELAAPRLYDKVLQCAIDAELHHLVLAEADQRAFQQSREIEIVVRHQQEVREGHEIHDRDVFQQPQPVTPRVIEAPDVAFRVEGLDGDTPVGHLVVKVNGRWVEARVGGIGGARTVN